MRALTLALLLAVITPFTCLQAQLTPTAPLAAAKPSISTNLLLHLSTENARPASIKIELMTERRQMLVTTLTNLQPGTTTLSCASLTNGNYYLYFSAPGYATQSQYITVKDGMPDKADLAVTLYRQRYAILRYAFNLLDGRELTGDTVAAARVAVAHGGSVPYFQGDWRVTQPAKDVMSLSFHRYSQGFGFAKPPVGAAYDDLKEAPTNTAYQCENTIAVKGLTLYCRVDGSNAGDTGYGKLFIEDITETPPPGIEIIEISPLITRASPPKAQNTTTNTELQLVLATENARPAQIKIELRPESSRQILHTLTDVQPGSTKLTYPVLTNGSYYLYFSAPGYAPQWQRITVKDGTLDKDTLKVELFRQRYVVLRYAFNPAGDRSLAGDQIKTDRVAVSHWGGLPNFRHDWQIWQKSKSSKLFGDTLFLEFHRHCLDFGFAQAPAGVAFEDLKEAPENNAYRCKDTLAIKGLILFCRVNGNRDEGLGYGKVMVEDITETPPPGIKVIEGQF